MVANGLTVPIPGEVSDEVQARPEKSHLADYPFLHSIRPALARVEEVIHEALQSDNRSILEVSTHLLRAGGKRIRPALVLLSGRLYREDHPALTAVAAAAELIHTATLVHDDTVDKAQLRRGIPTINAGWGEHMAILMGDYLFARAFAMLAETGDNRAVRIMADVVFQMCVGEIEQWARVFEPDQGELAYLDGIYKKTAYFIAECCRLGAVLGGAPAEEERALRDFGYGVGMGFQIIDDILDLAGDTERFGKNIGGDLRSGVVTLPVLYALIHSPQRRRIAEIIRGRAVGDREVAEIRALLERCGGFHYAFKVAERYTAHARRCLNRLPAGPARDALEGMADYLMQRDL